MKILSVLSHLTTGSGSQLRKFVDNSIQSFLDYGVDIRQWDGDKARLQVDIEINSGEEGYLVIRDNAAGIHAKDYPRAFRPAGVPSDTSGLSEFGMGMKSAACWFSPNWTVRTTALGEVVERTVHFDIAKIVEDDIEELSIETRPIEADSHFTEVALSNLHKPLQGRTIGKIQEHLASIYRVFIREGSLELRFRGEDLSYSEPETLCAPYYKSESECPQLWRKEIDFDFGVGLQAHGFAALRATASTSRADSPCFAENDLFKEVQMKVIALLGRRIVTRTNDYMVNFILTGLMSATPKMDFSGMKTKGRS